MSIESFIQAAPRDHAHRPEDVADGFAGALPASLEEKPDRDPRETEGMVTAAEGGLKYWQAAGTWLEHERAEYRLAFEATRQRALEQYAMIAADEQPWCEADREELEG